MGMEPVVHQYFDYFVETMKEQHGDEGVGLVEWTNWLALDLAADLSWSQKINQMKLSECGLLKNCIRKKKEKNLIILIFEGETSIHLVTLLGFNKFITVIQVFKRFPLLSPLQYLFAPFSKLFVFAAMENLVRDSILKRTENRGKLEHPDFFQYILPDDSPVPTEMSEFKHLGSVAQQFMFASFGPMSDWSYSTIFYILQAPACYKILVEEIRSSFQSYEDITPGPLVGLPYLQACLEESLRLMQTNNTGLPRYSPGAMVDGRYIPKGTTVQSSIFTLARSPRYFHDPLEYRPQRWLTPDHPLYESKYANDTLKGLYFFSIGTRSCIGREMAWLQGRLFLAKVLWTFDVTQVPGQVVDLEGTLLHYGFLIKPELRVKFVPVSR